MIRVVNNKDIDEIKDLTNAIDLVSYIESEDPFNKNFVYCSNDKIIGFLSYSIIYNRCELNYLFVNNNNRNQGVGSKLLKYMTNDCESHGCYNITLEVRENNDVAKSFYSKNKFKEVAIRKNYYGDLDGIMMERVLVKK